MDVTKHQCCFFTTHLPVVPKGINSGVLWLHVLIVPVSSMSICVVVRPSQVVFDVRTSMGPTGKISVFRKNSREPVRVRQQRLLFAHVLVSLIRTPVIFLPPDVSTGYFSVCASSFLTD